MFLRQDRLGLRRSSGRAHPRGLLLLPGEGARGHAAVPGGRSCPAAGSSTAARSCSPTSSRWPPSTPWSRSPRSTTCGRSQFTPELLEEALGAAFDFAGRAERFYPRTDAPAGELQPHAAGRGEPRAPAPAGVRRRGRALAGASSPGAARRSGRRRTARATGTRSWRKRRRPASAPSGSADGVHWLAPFAPAGAREVDRGGARRRAPLERSAPPRSPRSRPASPRSSPGTSREGLSAFNFTASAARSTAADRVSAVVLRVIARTAFKQDYRTDDYFLQKQLGGELMFAAPEEMAARLRTLWGADKQDHHQEVPPWNPSTTRLTSAPTTRSEARASGPSDHLLDQVPRRSSPTASS